MLSKGDVYELVLGSQQPASDVLDSALTSALQDTTSWEAVLDNASHVHAAAAETRSLLCKQVLAQLNNSEVQVQDLTDTLHSREQRWRACVAEEQTQARTLAEDLRGAQAKIAQRECQLKECQVRASLPPPHGSPVHIPFRLRSCLSFFVSMVPRLTPNL